MAKSMWNANNISDQTGRIVVITGAATGIGKEAARVLADKNAKVIIAARNLGKAEKAISDIRRDFHQADVSVRKMDLTSLASVEAFSDSILKDFDRIDVLINNAGIMACPYSKTNDNFEIQMGTNHLGHFALTGRLMPLLKMTEGSRIVVLSSIAHKFSKFDINDLNWEKKKYNTNAAYGNSKLANLYFTYELVRKLKEEGANSPLVTAAHPGWTKTDLQRHTGVVNFLNTFFSQGVEMGALPTLRAGFDAAARPGDYYGPAKHFEMHGPPVKVKSNPQSHNRQIAQRLWEKSEELTGVSF